MLDNFIFVINGSGTSGKDTLVEYFERNFKCYYGSHIYNISSIDNVRKAASLLGWTGSKSDSDREFLHQLKMLASKHFDHSTNYMVGSIAKFKPPFVGFFHIREPEEILSFKNIIEKTPTKIFTILIERKTSEKFSNDADKNVENFQYDYIIENNGTLWDFEIKIRSLFTSIFWENTNLNL